MCPFFGLPVFLSFFSTSTFCLASHLSNSKEIPFFTSRYSVSLAPFAPSATCYLPLACSANRSGNENCPPCSATLRLEIVGFLHPRSPTISCPFCCCYISFASRRFPFDSSAAGCRSVQKIALNSCECYYFARKGKEQEGSKLRGKTC